MKEWIVIRIFNININRGTCNTFDNHYIHQIYVRVRTNLLRVFQVRCVSAPPRLVNTPKNTNK